MAPTSAPTSAAADDHLQELRDAAGVQDVRLELREAHRPAPAAEVGVSDFYKIFSGVRRLVEQMKQGTGELRQLYAELSECTAGKRRTELMQRVAEKRRAVVESSKWGKDGLDGMLRFTEEGKRRQNEMPTELRMQQNQYMLALGSYRDALQAFQRVQTEGERMLQQAERRREDMRGADAAAGRADAAAGELQVQQLRQQRRSSATEQTAQVYAEWAVRDREAIHKLEVEMRELHQIFQDMAVLVDQQGDLLNDIRHNVDTAVEYVVKGRGELKKADAHQRKANRTKCYILACVVGVGVVLVIILAVVLSK